MKHCARSRRTFLKETALTAGVLLLPTERLLVESTASVESPQDSSPADYTLHIKASPLEIASKKIISTITYNGLSGSAAALQRSQQGTVDIFNDTDAPEQLHFSASPQYLLEC